MSTVGSQYSDGEIRDAMASSEIAGGSTYLSQLPDSDVPQRANADEIVSAPATASDFFAATNAANDVTGGGLVWIDGDVTINMSGSSGYISNCTVASDRGQNGSSGALLRMPDHGTDSDAYSGGTGTGLFTLQDNTRLFGLELRGPTYDYWDNPEHPGYLPLSEDLEPWLSRCMTINRSSAEIENCEIWGWSTQGIVIVSNASGNAPTPEIHHSDLHNCMQTSYGYGVESIRGHPYIHHMYFNATRHTLATFGNWDSGYVFEDSIIGPSTALFLLDSHNLGENYSGSTTDRYARDFYGRAGGNIEIRRVTITPTHVIDDADYDAGESKHHVSFGGEQWPVDGEGTVIENCRMAHNSASAAIYQRTSGTSDSGVDWSVPEGTDGTTENFIYQDNQYGAPETPYEAGYGAPLNIRGDTPQQTADLRVFARDSDGNPITGATITVERQLGGGS